MKSHQEPVIKKVKVEGARITQVGEGLKWVIPREYRDLTGVLREEDSDILLPHCLTDCAVEITPGAKLPKPKLYSMTLGELEEHRAFVDKNLTRGFIHSISQVVNSCSCLIPGEKGWLT